MPRAANRLRTDKSQPEIKVLDFRQAEKIARSTTEFLRTEDKEVQTWTARLKEQLK